MDVDRSLWRARPADASFRDWAAPDGTNLRRMDWPRPAGRNPRGRLLFAGGRGDFIEKYLESYAHWRDAGWDVTAFDWRGQGRSRVPAVDPDRLFDTMVADLGVFLADWNEEGQGVRVCVAHSMGAHLLLRVLVEQSPLLDAAVLVAPLLRVATWPLPPFVARWMTDLACTFGQSGFPIWRGAGPASLAQRQAFLTGSPERYADEAWWLASEPEFALGGPSWGWLRAAFRSIGSLREEDLAEVDTPVLLIGTATDRLVDPEAIREVAKLLPNSELHLYPKAGHEILREADPIRADALARIDDFLRRRAP